MNKLARRFREGYLQGKLECTMWWLKIANRQLSRKGFSWYWYLERSAALIKRDEILAEFDKLKAV